MSHQADQKIQSSNNSKYESSSPLEDIGNQVEKLAAKTADSIRRVIDKALASRNTVLTIRVNDECNEKLNMLVEAGLFRSRSESAAFLIQEGIKSQRTLFDKIAHKLKKIDQIREELKEIVDQEISGRHEK